MSKYLLIFEDGTMVTTTTITKDDKNHTNNGYLQLIDITDPNEVLEYYAGEWIAVGEAI